MATLTQLQDKLRSAQGSILFMQQDHAKTLKGLHEEMHKLQKKCAELTFQLAMETTSTPDEDYFRKKSVGLEKELKQKDDEWKDVQEHAEKKDKRIEMLEQQLRAQEKKFKDELKLKSTKMAQLSNELDSKSATIAYLTTQLHQVKVGKNLRKSREGVEALPEGMSPTPPSSREKSGSSRKTYRRGVTNMPVTGPIRAIHPSPPDSRDSSANVRTASGRRLPTPPMRPRTPSGSKVLDPAPFLESKNVARDREVSIKPAPAVLPPILPPTGDESEESESDASNRRTFLRRQLRLAKQADRSEVETLAVDQVGGTGDNTLTAVQNTESD
ncbi:coiled-coil domain-containing protein 92-like [Branchiostoma floridae x Branchiostoma japonicum]